MEPFTLQWWLYLLQEEGRKIGAIQEYMTNIEDAELKESCNETLHRLCIRIDWIRHRINRKYGEQKV